MASARSGVLESDALLIRAIPYGEADLVAQFFTQGYGRLSAMIRGGRRSRKRAGGGFEPFHTFRLRIEDRGRELCTVRDADIVVVRAQLVGDLAAMDAGGRALRWVRALFPPRVAEPEAWATIIALLDALDLASGGAQGSADAPASILAWGGLRFLAAAGFGLELDECLVCQTPCPDGRAALVDVARGGIVCRSCGGGELKLPARVRAAARAVALSDGPTTALGAAAAPLEALVVRAMEWHALHAPC